MKIFIGGASEDSGTLREIESWVSEHDKKAWPWDKPGTFKLGCSTFPTLIDISRQVDAAILIFSPNDEVYYRGDTAGQPRDNVLIEYGLFASALGPEKCAIAVVGDSKIASDLAGISFLDLRGKRKPRGRIELGIWLNSLSSSPLDPAVVKQKATNHQLKEENESLKDELIFERENANKLKQILKSNDGVDFGDLSSDKYWKLLFNYKAVNSIANDMKMLIDTPQDLKKIVNESGVNKVSEAVAWARPDSEDGNRNPEENGKFSRKVLRAFKMLAESEDVVEFVEGGERGIKAAFQKAEEKYAVES